MELKSLLMYQQGEFNKDLTTTKYKEIFFNKATKQLLGFHDHYEIKVHVFLCIF